jgi:hypothetical protein
VEIWVVDWHRRNDIRFGDTGLLLLKILCWITPLSLSFTANVSLLFTLFRCHGPSPFLLPQAISFSLLFTLL